MSESDNNSEQKGLLKFCSNVINNLRTEPYLSCAFGMFVVYTMVSAFLHGWDKIFPGVIFIACLLIVGRRFRQAEAYKVRMKELEITRIDVEGQAKVAQYRARLEARGLSTAAGKKSPSKSLPPLS